MRIKTINATNVLPVKSFSAENLSDVVVLAGPNGVGKTRLIDGLLQFFHNPKPQANIRLLIEGSNSSLDKQTYGAILKDKFPSLVLVPGGGKGILSSFAFLHKEVLEKTIWGVEFFMLCDRDAIPPSKPHDVFVSNERMVVLKRYHIENYFLDETVLAKIFSKMEPDQSWLTSPQEIRTEIKKIARNLVSYTAALTASAYFRESVGTSISCPRIVTARVPTNSRSS